MAVRRPQRPTRLEPFWGPGMAVWGIVIVGFDLVLPALATIVGRRFAVLGNWLGLGAIVAVIATGAVWCGRERGRRLRARRRSRGQCVACGYSVRESSERCGECGHPLPSGHRRVSEAVSALERMG